MSTTQKAWAGEDPHPDSDMMSRRKSIFPYLDLNYGRWLPKNKSARILDFGVGAGGVLDFLAQRGYQKNFGFDIDTRYADFCAKTTTATISPHHSTLEFFEKDKGQYELIICRGVVCYWSKNEQEHHFKALANLLSPKGILIIEVVNAASFTHDWLYVNDPYIQTRYNEILLNRLAEDSSLKVLELRGEYLPINTWKGHLLKLVRKVWFRILRTIYLIERGDDPWNPKVFGKHIILIAQKE
jgi:SAM-dependent methyltransferase